MSGIGILTGKRKRYNKLILEALFYGDKTIQQIAEYIFQKTQGESDKRSIPHIRSVIERPNARLEELEKLGYIERKNKIYEATLKGFALASTWAPRQDIEHSSLIKNLYLLKDINPKTILKKVGLPKNKINALDHVYRKFFANPINVLLSFRDAAEKLTMQGTDFDKISEDDIGYEAARGWASHLVDGTLKYEKKGSSLKNTKKCSHCGHKILDESPKFCPNCGREIL